MGVLIVTINPDIIEFLDELVNPIDDYTHPDYDDFWCIQILPFRCPGCRQMITHAQVGDHFILIWAEKDDDTILEMASGLKKAHMDPRIVHYNRDDGSCIEFYEAMRRGYLDGA